eukprot:TRINITY_DN95096_c0_g1_i1.p1 TRINITY_DN95096_c0_g1~~TRINITY_DN95096_c0_g1_i1.p1  ORF type:complete len:587 (+),score=111.60 TRINITY_DN95096_c0_g1_i1:191-1762(+)
MDEIREFVRCESWKRMQLGMRLQKQQESLEQLSEMFRLAVHTGEDISSPGTDDPRTRFPSVVSTLDVEQRSARLASDFSTPDSRGWRDQMDAEVETVKSAVQQLWTLVKSLQESAGTSATPYSGDNGRTSLTCDSNASSLLLDVSASSCKGATDEQDGVDEEGVEQGELDRSYRNQDAGFAADGGIIDVRWIEQRLEETQQELSIELSNLDQRLAEEISASNQELTNIKGFVDATTVTICNRVATLEYRVATLEGFVKGSDESDGISAQLERKMKEVAEDFHAGSAEQSERLQKLKDTVSDASSRLASLESRVDKQQQQLSERLVRDTNSSRIGFSPGPDYRSPSVLRRGGESMGNVSGYESVNSSSMQWDKAAKTSNASSQPPVSPRPARTLSVSGMGTPRSTPVQSCTGTVVGGSVQVAPGRPQQVVNVQQPHAYGQMLAGRSAPFPAAMPVAYAGAGSATLPVMAAPVQQSPPTMSPMRTVRAVLNESAVPINSSGSHAMPAFVQGSRGPTPVRARAPPC